MGSDDVPELGGEDGVLHQYRTATAHRHEDDPQAALPQVRAPPAHPINDADPAPRSPVATHLLAAAMFALAACGTVLQLAHARARRVLRLAHAPGTIASAVSLGAHTGLGAALAGRVREDEMRAALGDKRFRIDPRTHRIVVEGDAGFCDAHSPAPGRTLFGFAPAAGGGRGAGFEAGTRV